jgi:hypothetical protein
MLNETKWFAENATYRAVTGGAFNFPLGDGTIESGDGVGSGNQFPYKGTVPRARILPGLISSTGVMVRGDDDANFDHLKKGDYLYDGNVLREILVIDTSKLLTLKEAFPSDVEDITIQMCERQLYKKIRAKSTHSSNAAILQEASFKAGDEFENGGAPISYDASVGEISFTVHR